MNPIRAFITFNQRIAGSIEHRLDYAQQSPFTLFSEAVAEAVDSIGSGVVVDIGGGRACSFVHDVDRTRLRIIAVDIDPDELALNTDVDEWLVSDAGKSLPLENRSVDMVTSRTVLEHIENVETTIAESARVLRDGGYAIHLVPCRYAPFALIARAIPFGVAKRILHFLRPQAKGVVEFPVFYTDCYDSKLRTLHLRHGFTSYSSKIVFFQSNYFDAFLPAFLLSVAYERILVWRGQRDLGAYVVCVARK